MGRNQTYGSVSTYRGQATEWLAPDKRSIRRAWSGPPRCQKVPSVVLGKVMLRRTGGGIVYALNVVNVLNV